MVLLFLFKEDTNDHKSYKYEVSLIDIHIIYIYIYHLNSVIYYIKYVNLKICSEKLLRS